MRVFSGFVVSVLLLLTACDPCGDVTITGATSPGGQYTVVENGSDCGATTSYETFVSIRRTKAIWGYHRKRTVFSGYFGPDQISSTWKDSNSLEIHCNCKSDRIVHRESGWNGINIEYTFTEESP
jgi:hypothetical protein